MSREGREHGDPEGSGSETGTGKSVHRRARNRKDLDREELEELHRRATGPGHPPRGPVRWASSVLGVAPRTVRRWLSGETRPTVRQVARLRVAARVAEEARRRRLQEARREDPTRATLFDRMAANLRELLSVLNPLETMVAERASDALLAEEERAHRRGTAGVERRRKALVNRGYPPDVASELASKRRRPPRWLDKGNAARRRARRS